MNKRTYKIGELSTLLKRGITPSYTDEHLVKVVNQKCIRGFQINLDLAKYTDPVKKNVSDEKYLENFDVLVNSTGVGTLGRVAQIFEINQPTTADSHVTIIRPNQNIVDPLYFGYYMKSIQKNIEMLGEGSTGQTELSRVLLSDLEIDIIENIEQQRIVSEFLKVIDTKIELNQQVNKTLEEIAKTLFKSWFIDFDPVRAKAEGRPTGLSQEINDLFPDELVNVKSGEIPKGWEFSPLSKFIMEVGEKTKPSPETKLRPYVPIDCISSKSLTLKEFKNGAEAKSSLVSFKKGDILFGAMRPYFHKVCIAPFDGTTRTTCLVLRSNVRDYFCFSLLTLFHDRTIDFATQNSTGSTIPYIKWKNELETLTVSLPPVELAGQFNKLLEPILEKLLISIEEQKILSELRDTLLPKLISGELKVSDAENLIEEASVE